MIGVQKQSTSARIALAWLLAQKPWIVPIPGTRKLARLEENMAAANVELSIDELGDIDATISKIAVSGARVSGHEGYVGPVVEAATAHVISSHVNSGCPIFHRMLPGRHTRSGRGDETSSGPVRSKLDVFAGFHDDRLEALFRIGEHDDRVRAGGKLDGIAAATPLPMTLPSAPSTRMICCIGPAGEPDPYGEV